MARLRFAAFGAVLAGLLAGFAGCSGDSKVAGNSAETGSPELASIEGRLYLGDSRVAALARICVVPQNFDVYDDTASILGESDENGVYRLNNVKSGIYSLEAVAESGERLLVQNVVVSDEDSVVVQNDTLRAPGFALLKLNFKVEEGTAGVVTAIGTTIYREVSVSGGLIFVDSLPAGSLDLRLSLDGVVEYYDAMEIVPGDTAKNFVEEEIADTLVMRFVAPLAAPEGSVDSLMGYVSDIPLALRLTPENCDFDTLAGMDGRWEVRRINVSGGSSKKLPIASGYFDTLAQEAVFWVNVDSLNLDDSLELVFNNTLKSGFALDVFPTNRSYAMVWHFDDGVSPVFDGAEKRNFPGISSNVSAVDGVLGSAALMSLASSIVAENSAEADSSLHEDLVYGLEDFFDFSLWIRLESLDDEQTIFEKSGEYELRYDPESGFVVNIYHVATESAENEDSVDTVDYKLSWASGNEGLEPKQWIFVAFSKHAFDKAGNGHSSLFVNGAKVNSPAKSAWNGERGTANDFKIGGFAGAIDEVFVGGSFRSDIWTYMTYLNQKPSGYWPVLRPSI